MLNEDPSTLRALLDSMGAGAYATDPAGLVSWVNREAEVLLGLSAADLVGREAHATLHRRPDGATSPRQECPLLDVLTTGARAEAEDDTFLHGDGHLLPVSWISAPVVQDGAVVGAVVVFRDTSAARALREQREAALAAERREQERVRVALERLELLGAVTSALAGSEDVVDALPGVLQLLVPRLGDTAGLELVDAPDLPCAESDHVHREHLRARGQLIGCLVLGRYDRAHLPEERELAHDLAGRMALALDNDRLLRAQRELSRSLQASLLDLPLHDPALQVAVRYQTPGRFADVGVGGDWYDCFALPGGATALVIGDIAGHDAESAARMASARNILRGLAVDRDASPADVLRRLDRATEALGTAGLATVVMARVCAPDADGRMLEWSNAGHPPPLLVHRDGRTELLDTDPDLPLGVLPDAERTDARRALPPGATLLLYTDGLIETRADSMDVGLARLREAASRHAQDDVERFCDGVLADLTGSHDSPDDIAVLALRVPDA